jgi:membrane protein DedA with SNARE-associated domain
MNGLAQSTIAFVQQHQHWGAAIVFMLAFCESFAFISLFVPATGILFGVGGLIAAADIGFWPIWIAAALGAVAGDWLAYDLAFRFKGHITALWPFRNHRALVSRGLKFFESWGLIAVFMGRFFGPLRAIVPIAAGLYAMPWLKFQAANFASAALWATGILTPGFLSVHWLVG